MVNDSDRKREQAKYKQVYASRRRNYSMGQERMVEAIFNLKYVPCRGSFLDVACGKGEMVDTAVSLGFNPCHGTEIIPSLIDGDRVVYAECHSLPFEDNMFDVVTAFDVLEHLLPDDDAFACREMQRVGKRFVLISVNNGRSKYRGVNLHPNCHSYAKWDQLLQQWFRGKVTWLEVGVSSTWLVELEKER